MITPLDEDGMAFPQSSRKLTFMASVRVHMHTHTHTHNSVVWELSSPLAYYHI